MGRTLPVECGHGSIIDWGDFGDYDPEPCDECAKPSSYVTVYIARTQLQAIERLLREQPITNRQRRAALNRVKQALR